jgi:hypothetical protein
MATLAGRPREMTAERRFFTIMASIVLVSTFIGFMPSYYLRGIATPYFPFPPMTLLVHVHALVFSAWVVLFLAQTSLVAAGRVDIHRRLGVLGMGLIALMIPLGIWVGLAGVGRPTAPPGIDPLSWASVPLMDVPVFGGLIVMALIKRRNPQIHKRLMLIAMINMLQPSLGRMPFPIPGIGMFLPILLLLPLFVWDWKSRGRIHPATLWGSLLVVTVMLVRPMIWGTPAWMDFARWASSFVI